MNHVAQKYKVSLELLLQICIEALKYEYPKKFLYFAAPEKIWIHAIPRLLLLLEGSHSAQFYRNGKIEEMQLSAPCIIYCSAKGFFDSQPISFPCRALSFSFTPDYIRAMHIDYLEGVEAPTDRDVYYHTNKPLSNGGQRIIESIDTLGKEKRWKICESLLRPLLEVTIDDLRTSLSSDIPTNYNLANEIYAYLRAHRDRSISREQLGRIFHISPGYISHIVHTHLGKTFGEILQELRLERGAMLLCTTRLSVNEIAEMCGYNYTNYFIRRFVQCYGMTPHVFRNNQHVMNRPNTLSGKTRGIQTEEDLPNE